jgi:hypothetical protein
MGSGKWEAGMLRAALLAFALAFIPASASTQTASEQQLPPGWGFIRMMGWTFQGSGGSGDDEVLFFTMPAPQPMHIWFRRESKPVGDLAYSARTLEQVDCNARRKRRITISYFARNNLEELKSSNENIQNWEYPAPGTLGEIPLLVLCD